MESCIFKDHKDGLNYTDEKEFVVTRIYRVEKKYQFISMNVKGDIL